MGPTALVVPSTTTYLFDHLAAILDDADDVWVDGGESWVIENRSVCCRKQDEILLEHLSAISFRNACVCGGLEWSHGLTGSLLGSTL